MFCKKIHEHYCPRHWYGSLNPSQSDLEIEQVRSSYDTTSVQPSPTVRNGKNPKPVPSTQLLSSWDEWKCELMGKCLKAQHWENFFRTRINKAHNWHTAETKGRRKYSDNSCLRDWFFRTKEVVFHALSFFVFVFHTLSKFFG